jgi:uncharacterized protein YdhG (YjbR/CyaY superfamily)
MAKTDYQSVDHYLAAQPAKARSVLDVVRAAIRGALPEAEEQISYQIPAYRGVGGTFLYFAGWKAHYSIYPASGALVAAFAEELKPYQVNKGTIRFPYDGPVPATLIRRIARFLADEAAARKK